MKLTLSYLSLSVMLLAGCGSTAPSGQPKASAAPTPAQLQALAKLRAFDQAQRNAHAR